MSINCPKCNAEMQYIGDWMTNYFLFMRLRHRFFGCKKCGITLCIKHNEYNYNSNPKKMYKYA